ncbi:MAG: hypothetical protein JRI25_03615, partial [Deltaproteobacteria bacterium]|nr:hypothetical protein [Deltaproteobacteria bacterium]
HSYFDGEADGSWVEAIPEGAVFGDALPLLVRGLAGTLVEPGETRTVPYLPTLLDTRLAHQPLVWQEVTLSRSAGPRMVQVPVGPVEVFTITSRVLGRGGRAAPPIDGLVPLYGGSRGAPRDPAQRLLEPQ